MGWATLSAAANRVAAARLGSVSVIAGAVTGRGFLKQNSEMLLNGEIVSIDYALTVETLIFGALAYGAAITVVFLLIVLALTLLQVKAGEKRTHYG